MRHTISFLLSAAILLLAACTADDVQLTPDASAPQGDIIGATLHFDCAYPSAYDDATDTRAAEQWQTGDKIFIRFKKADGTLAAHGTATRQPNGTWTLDMANPGIDSGTCEVYFFTNYSGNDNYSTPVLTFNAQDGTYSGEGTFTKSGASNYIVRASLAPTTCRIRFQGDVTSTVSVLSSSEFVYLKQYTKSNMDFEVAQQNLTLSGSPARTNYIYPLLSTSDDKVTIDIEYAGSKYSRTVTMSQLTKSNNKWESCCIKLPSSGNLNGWEKEQEINNDLKINLVDVVTFKTDILFCVERTNANVKSFRHYICLTTESRDAALSKLSQQPLNEDEGSEVLEDFLYGISNNASPGTDYNIYFQAYDASGNAGPIRVATVSTLPNSAPYIYLQNRIADRSEIWTSLRNGATKFYVMDFPGYTYYQFDPVVLAHYMYCNIQAYGRASYTGDITVTNDGDTHSYIFIASSNEYPLAQYTSMHYPAKSGEAPRRAPWQENNIETKTVKLRKLPDGVINSISSNK